MGKTKFTTEIKTSIRWGEMDALNHVNNAVYFSYFEDARIEYLNSIGYGDVNVSSGSGPILANISCDFLKPLTYPDQIIVGVGTTRLGTSSMTVDYEVYSEKLEEVVAKGSSVVVMIDYNEGKSIPLPDWMRVKILERDKSLITKVS